MIETWEFDYPLLSWFQLDFQKISKNDAWIYEFCACSSTKLWQSSTCSHDRCRLYAPWAKSPELGTAHCAIFLKEENLQESMIVGRKNPTKQKTCLFIVLFLSSRLYTYGNASKSETLEFMIDFSKNHRCSGGFCLIFLEGCTLGTSFLNIL